MIFPLLQRKIIRGVKEHVAQGLHPAVDYEAHYEPLRMPCEGVISTFQEPEGGNWLQITRDNGDVLQFAHLSEYKIKNGRAPLDTIIAVTGASGNLTANGFSTTQFPHLHIQIKDGQGNWLDPESYFFPKSIPIVAINGTIEAMQKFQEALLKYSAGMLTCSWDIVQAPAIVQDGLLTQDQAYPIAQSLDRALYAPYRYVFIFYTPNIHSTFLATYYHPELDQTITTLPTGAYPRNMCFEFGHALQILEDVHSPETIDLHDTNFPTDTLIIEKLRDALKRGILIL